MILSPNCCAVTILNIHQLMSSCYPAVCLSEHVASKSKWQSADLDLLKLAKKKEKVCPALFRGNVCIWSDTISNVRTILGRKCTARLKVNQNTRSPPLSESLNFEKEWPFLFWVVVYRPVFLLLYKYADLENLHVCLKSFQKRRCSQLVFHWVSKPIHLTRIRCSGWVRAA